MGDFRVPPEAVEAAWYPLALAAVNTEGFPTAPTHLSDAQKEACRTVTHAALTAAIPKLLPALRDHLAAGAGEPPWPQDQRSRLLTSAYRQGAAAMAADRDRWRAMAEQLGELIYEWVEGTRADHNGDFATWSAGARERAALRDLQAMKEAETDG